MATFFFCGIGGIGMSAIALYLQKSGQKVYGSDRSFDMNKNQIMKEALQKEGIKLFSQDGSGVTTDVDYLVVSSAVEESIPDVKKALELEIPIYKRAKMLADIFHTFSKKIAIAGTSGKTTVTAMTTHILYEQLLKPVMINGGISLNTYNGDDQSNLVYENSDICVVEADESDGSIELYNPSISVVTNISLDHKPLEETKPLFERFLARAEMGCVINKDCLETKTISLPEQKIVSFSVEKDSSATLYACSVEEKQGEISFVLNGKKYYLPFIGVHNLSNALTAVAACSLLGVDVDVALLSLRSFKGTKRRLETVGVSHNKITVIDDYAHNEEKIKASLSALKKTFNRVFVIYQPHGFAPLRLMKDGLIEMLKTEITDAVYWGMLPVYYVGGTVSKTISSEDVIRPLIEENKQAVLFENREEAKLFVLKNIQSGDAVVVMGARDDTLSLFAKEIFVSMEN